MAENRFGYVAYRSSPSEFDSNCTNGINEKEAQERSNDEEEIVIIDGYW